MGKTGIIVKEEMLAKEPFPLYIESLRLHDFRSYRQVMLTPPRGTTVFVGENGTGKTNLLEAVHLCCLGRSHRTSNDREMIRQGAETCAVQVRVQRGDGADTVGVRLFLPAEKKRKVLCLMMLIVMAVTPLGGNNKLYSVINNLFLILPVDCFNLLRFRRKLKAYLDCFRLPIVQA